ncbi:MAG: DUF294 nucleotidyltransferase-like domain-containing protein [Balneolia bacterium]|nr:DUF294 nucleotidyltransferase-like domain-containing protein [Balneolia bacterium]
MPTFQSYRRQIMAQAESDDGISSSGTEDRIGEICGRIIHNCEFNHPADLRPRLGEEIGQLLDDGMRPSQACRVVTKVADELMSIGFEHAIKKMGEAPARWMLMLMGSEGRTEQTLRTDQDSAIVFESRGKEQDKSARDYFTKIGRMVSDGLNGFGFLYCKGGVMASNPEWVMPLDQWKAAFSGWVEEPEPMAIMKACIFFDLRAGYGDRAFADELNTHIRKLLDGRSGLFFYHMAQNALSHSVPLGLFGGISRSASRSMDIKKAMLPVTDHARIYALQKGITLNNTLDRIAELDSQKSYNGAESVEAAACYEFLTELRLRHQIGQLREGGEPDNIIDPSALSQEQKNDLIAALKLSDALQKNIGMNFRAAY